MQSRLKLKSETVHVTIFDSLAPERKILPYIIPFLLIAIGSAFEHEQAIHAKNFRGGSQTFCTILWISVYTSWIVRIAILAHIGIKLSWVAAITMFFGGILASGIIAGLLAGIAGRTAGAMGQVYISLAAFALWPLCFLAAYLSLPTVV